MSEKQVGNIEIQNMDRFPYELYWVKPGIDNQRCINTMRKGDYFKVADHEFYLKKIIDLSTRSKSYGLVKKIIPQSSQAFFSFLVHSKLIEASL